MDEARMQEAAMNAKAAMLMRGGGIGGGNSPSAISWTQRDRINSTIADCERRLAAAKRAAEILEANPDLEELLNLLQQF